MSLIVAPPQVVNVLRIASVLIAFGLLGCQPYTALPITPQSMDDAIRPPGNSQLLVMVSQIHHPILRPIQINLDQGITPDQAAVIALVVNPELRALRDARGVSAAVLLQAGIMPNPALGHSSDFITGGFTAGTFNAYGATLSWDVEQLISRSTKMKAAEFLSYSIDLLVAWQEWQTAQAAKQAVYDLLSLQSQLAVLIEIDNRLGKNVDTVNQAYAEGLQTTIDLAAAQAAARDSYAAVLQGVRDVEHQRLLLNRAIGFPPDQQIKLMAGLALPSCFEPPATAGLTSDLEQHRIDLVGVRSGYQSQEQTLRAAILEQFPRINPGFNNASDNSNIHSVGLVATIDLPIFGRNQGAIAAEIATRQRLMDEYIDRVFTGQSDIESIQIPHAEKTESIVNRRFFGMVRSKLKGFKLKNRIKLTADFLRLGKRAIKFSDAPQYLRYGVRWILPVSRSTTRPSDPVIG